ncbi:uncharacterized protein [Amphiura filiformis]|uniref:uncharacterized protein n=1 Tax=Amphiura filiformis TaxID=82378 RepID=UPI003B21A5CB
MAMRDPHLTNLKGILQKLREDDKPIRDSNPDLQRLCDTIESIFRKGLKKPGSLFGLYNRDYWCWIESLPNYLFNERLNPIFGAAIDTCKTSPKVKTNQGRGRFFIRIALNKNILSVPIEHLLKNPRLTEYWYDPGDSIIGNELMVESLMSLLFWATELKFELNLRNTSFLDQTWVMPVLRHYELVPCKQLGVLIRYIKNRVVVAAIQPGSVAEENNRIEAGDLMDEMYGENLYGNSKGKVPKLLSQHEGWPIYVSVIKVHTRSGKVFHPLKELHLTIQQEFPDFPMPSDRQPIRESTSPDASGEMPEGEGPVHNSSGSAIYKVKYVGRTDVGREGGTCVIEGAIAKVLQEKGKDSSTYQEGEMELAETNVITRNPDGTEEIWRHSYPEISSCGRRVDSVIYFAYVAGDTTCTISKHFHCYVFQARTERDSKTILTSIAQGFGRTTWFV